MDFRRGHRVTNVFRKRSQGHGRISAVTNCDPGRGRMHCAYGSDHPLTQPTFNYDTDRLHSRVAKFRIVAVGNSFHTSTATVTAVYIELCTRNINWVSVSEPHTCSDISDIP